MITLEGYHGTSSKAANSILKSGYKLSVGDKEWLGDGVYFFVDGISSDLLGLSKKWAIAQSWDKEQKQNKYKKYSILKSVIEVEEDNLLDLTVQEGVEIFTYLSEKYEDKIKDIGKKLKYVDGLLLNLARKERILPLEVVKGNFYIKFTRERIKKINSRISNCTICSVYDPLKNILNTELVKTGTL